MATDRRFYHDAPTPIGVAAPPSGAAAAPAPQPAAAADGPEVSFVLQVARALHRFGTPSHRLEGALEQVTQSLGWKGQFFSLPTSVFASLEREGTTRTALLRAEPGDVDLGRLSELYAVIRSVLQHGVPLSAAQQLVQSILTGPPRYGPLLTIACFGLASASAARFFGASAREILVTFLLGLSVGGLARLAQRVRSAAGLFEPMGAALTAVLAAAAASVWPPVRTDLVVLAGLIVLVPGFTFTAAMTELGVRHLASGSMRLAWAAAIFLGLTFGVAVGSRAGSALFPAPSTAGLALASAAPWTLWLALLVAPLAFTVLFQARHEDAPLILLACTVGFWGARLGARLLEPQLGVFVGAVLVGCIGNAYARAFRRPASVAIVPGILLLVPGSLGLKSLASLMARDVLTGMQGAFTMTIISVALAMGLLVANVVVPPRSAL